MPDLVKERYYQEKTARFQSLIEQALADEEAVLEVCRNDPAHAADKQFGLSNSMLDLASLYLCLNGTALFILKQKNEAALREARKSVYKAVIYTESIVTTHLNAPFSDYAQNLLELEGVDIQERYDFARKMGLTIDLLEAAFGEQSKMHWAFVELRGRFATISKNLVDLSKIKERTDPASPYYEPSSLHIHLVKRLLGESALSYRDRFEIFSKKVEDLQIGMNFSGALRYVHIALGESIEADLMKKQCDAFNARIETELAKKRHENQLNVL